MHISDAEGLPVRDAVPALRAALDDGGAAVLAAPPGTGKTTLVPLALAGLALGGPPGAGKVLVLEPRRLAARAAARRMAWLLGERVGGRVGLTVRGESRPGTRVDVVTTGVVLQRLQSDPELADVGTVILDECHERHLDADTALAFLLDVRAALRPDLRVVAASATADTGPWARLLGDAPVVETPAALHPVETVWAPPPRPVAPPHGMRVDPALLGHVAATVRRALAERDGDVLCFLPGAGEIARVAGMLGDAPAEILQVHGQAPPAVQDAVLAPSGRRRVVLATSVAESSLTVPGVRAVVDGGLAREPRTDHARGLGALTTVRASRATAAQRAGRAGREAPGTVYRCWTEAEHERLPARPRPEIELADLTGFALQTACWGDPGASGLALLDPPPPAALDAARTTLRALGALEDGGVTGRGRALARIGRHPRLARALVDGAPEVGSRAAAEIVALLSEPPPRSAGDDLTATWRALRRPGRPADAHAARWRDEVRRLRRAAHDDGPVEGPAGDAPSDTWARRGDDAVAGVVVALAFPERVARARRGSGHLMASGTGAVLDAGSALAGARPAWLAIAAADRPSGSASARVRQAVVIDEEVARFAAAPLLETAEEIAWRDGDVAARRVERLGAIELDAAPLRDPDPERMRAALLEGLRAEGLGLLNWTAAATGLRRRLAFLHHALGDPWPAVDDAALLGLVPQWLAGARRRADLKRVDVAAMLRGLLAWDQAKRLDEYAPERVEVPSGSRIRVDYSGERPVLAVKLQELFGWDAAPRLAGGRVPLVVHLLSPAGRPAAVTADLASFWREGYRAVRAELRGRYPRHPWPEDPAQAVPTKRTKRASGS
ncbi:ATP-dependent helicase HrpB [Actinomadura livida]|uniref:ATP-dependent helicase HrpB n=1 Tax=Actinomadura livida TaxID=79909 RepID=A0A7W7ICB4_9ACTN|nr:MULTISPECIES: ATP-dependent helicase HrpB [Actinomadura]MBB4774492.1 ATP-dependent helicase HrpB [Actinomadura catellatispora]GGT82167.1 ATP-dependent helicase [Actinomadura livida]